MDWRSRFGQGGFADSPQDEWPGEFAARQAYCVGGAGIAEQLRVRKLSPRDSPDVWLMPQRRVEDEHHAVQHLSLIHI